MWKKKKQTWGGVLLESKKKKRKVGIGILSIVLVLVLLLGLSYAWFTLISTGTKQNVVKIGSLSLELTDEEAIKIDNLVPTYMNAALKEKPYHFTITNNGTVEASYYLYLDNIGTITNLSRFNYALKKDGKIVKMGALNKLSNSLLAVMSLSPKEVSQFDLFIWLDSNTSPTFADRYLTGTYESTIRIEASQQKEMSLASAMIQRTSNGETLDGENHYVTSSDQIAYIWYSGKMWAAISYNDNGEVKAITESAQTVLPWGSSEKFTESNIYTWINDTSSTGFLGNLYHYEDFLVTDYPWNYSETTRENFWTSIGNDMIVKGPVGMLNTWDLVKANGENQSFSFGNFLTSEFGSYYVGNPIVVNGTKQIMVSSAALMGGEFAYTPSELYANVSPVVVFKKEVKVISGSGTEFDPYILKGDQRKCGSLLNTAVSGEYVAFGDQVNYKYRISSTKDQKVQLVANNTLLVPVIDGEEEYFEVTVNTGNTGDFAYSTELDFTNYNPNSKEYPAAYYLNHAFLASLNGYFTKEDLNMMERDQTWELTTLIAGQNDYKNASKTTSTATVGFLKAGDLLTVPEQWPVEEYMGTSLSNSDMILLTNNGSGLIAAGEDQHKTPALVNDTQSVFYPSFYLKSSVKIKSGRGTMNDPYILTME